MNDVSLIKEKVFFYIYRNGFNNTSIQDLADEVGLTKAGIMYHFKNKKELGFQYLEYRRYFILNLVRGFSDKYKSTASPEVFINAFTKYIIKMAKTESFVGCAFTRFKSQLEAFDNRFDHEIARIEDDWLALYTDFFTRVAREKGSEKKIKPKNFAKRAVAYYEGFGHMYILTNDISYLHLLKPELLKLVNEIV